MAKELVLAQIQGQQIAPADMQSALNSTYEALQNLQAAEASGSSGNGNGADERLEAAAAVDWKKSVMKHSVTCLECGEAFKQLSLPHLSTHDLDPRTYQAKYKIPRSQALSAKEVTARQRELAQQIRPWELAAAQQADAAKAAAPASKNGAAKPAVKAASGGKAKKKAAAKG